MISIDTERYHEWIRRQPCAVGGSMCGGNYVRYVHHVNRKRKDPDDALHLCVMPVCRECHTVLHSHPEPTIHQEWAWRYLFRYLGVQF